MNAKQADRLCDQAYSLVRDLWHAWYETPAFWQDDRRRLWASYQRADRRYSRRVKLYLRAQS